jgi:hypothetical protein
MKKKIADENIKKFSDLSNKAWIAEDNVIKVGDSALKVMKGESETITAKEIFYGEPWQTFRIIIDQQDKVFLLKTSRELK